MITEQTDQGEQHVIPGAERKAEHLTDRQLAERHMVERTKTTKPQQRIESTPLFGGLPPHQDTLF